jgi:hypothetical protein
MSTPERAVVTRMGTAKVKGLLLQYTCSVGRLEIKFCEVDKTYVVRFDVR